MELPINPVAIPVAAVAALVVGALWYNPKIGFGNLWMRESGMTEEKMKSGKMGVIFGLSLAFAALLSLLLMQFTNHQWGAFGMIGGDPEAEGVLPSFQTFISDYGTNFRTFKHGVFQGALAGIFFVLRVLEPMPCSKDRSEDSG